MNHWTQLSIEYANQRSYLDDLFQVYPLVPDGIRDIDQELWKNVEHAFKNRDNSALLENLLKLKLFPIKDSYVAFLKRDKAAVERNPATVARLCGRVYEMELSKVFERCSEPKETNRQIGPLFKQWLEKKSLGIKPIGLDKFTNTRENAILDASDAEMMAFAHEHLNYNLDKGLDFVARFNGKYAIGEAKFLTDFGGHQNAQFNDAIATVKAKGVKAEKIIVLDGYLCSLNYSKMYEEFSEAYKDYNTMSVLVLRNFLYQL